MSTKKIRVLHVGLSAHLGGIETYLRKIAYNIDRDKFQFDFLVFGNETPCYYKELMERGCKFYRVTSRRDNFFKNKAEIRQLFEKEHFDIVHSHLNSLSYITPANIAKTYGCKIILHSHNSSLAAGAFSAILHTINSTRRFDKTFTLVAVSDLAGKWMFGKRKYRVFNNGIETDTFRFDPTTRDRTRKSMRLDEQEVILHVGAFRKQKNHEFVIEIFRDYVKKHSKAVLLLVGIGELKAEIEKKVHDYAIQKQVFFLGIRYDVAELMMAADKFFFPSQFEGFPIALIEAETTGLPCVAADAITREAMISGLCTAESLSSPKENWINALEEACAIGREGAYKKVEALGLGIKTEIEKLEHLYCGIL